jgi:hypothetical protein
MPDSTDTSLGGKPTDYQFEDARNSPYDEKHPDRESAAAIPPSFAGVDEAAVLRKMDIRLIPMLSALYLLAFLDRGNIGNAKIEGLVEDLHMTGPQYNWTCMCKKRQRKNEDLIY